MGEFNDVLKTRKRLKQSKNEVETLGKAIGERGRKTVKVPYFSDKDTGKLMIDRKNLSRKVRRMSKVYKNKRNLFAAKAGGKALLAGAVAYGGKKLLDDYDSSNEKYAGYPARVKESFGRLVNLRRHSNEVKASAQKAGRMLKKELKKKKPDPGELGHLNAKKVKESITAKRKRRTEMAEAVAGPVLAVGGGVYLKKKYDETPDMRPSHFIR